MSATLLVLGQILVRVLPYQWKAGRNQLVPLPLAADDAVQVVESRSLVVRRRHDLQCGWQLCADVFKNGNPSAHGQRLEMEAGPPSATYVLLLLRAVTVS